MVQEAPQGYYHIDHQNAPHCGDLGSVDVVGEEDFRCFAALHTQRGQEDIDDFVEDVRRCLGAEFLQTVVVVVEMERRTVVANW